MQPPNPDDTLDYYEVLQVSRRATPEMIRAAYRLLAQQYHPDVAGSDPRAAQRIREVNAAYSVLRDPVKRANYDAQRAWAARGTSASSTASATRRPPSSSSSYGSGTPPTSRPPQPTAPPPGTASRPTAAAAAAPRTAGTTTTTATPPPALTPSLVRQAIVLTIIVVVLLGLLIGALMLLIQAMNDEPDRYFESWTPRVELVASGHEASYSLTAS